MGKYYFVITCFIHIKKNTKSQGYGEKHIMFWHVTSIMMTNLKSKRNILIYNIHDFKPNSEEGTSSPEVQKVVNPVILDDRKYIQNQGLGENISKT